MNLSSTTISTIASINDGGSLLVNAKTSVASWNQSFSPITTSATVSNATSSSAISASFTTFVQIVCVSVLVTGVTGNSLVLIAFGLKWSKLKTCEIFMISLAVADLFGSVVIPTQHLVELTGGSFHFIGHIGCQLLSWTGITVMTVSAITLFTISIDRFIVVKWPMRERTESWKIIVVIILTWIISSTLGAPYFMDHRVKLTPSSASQHVCRTHWKSDVEDRIHTIAVFCIQVIVPITCMTVLYGLIVIELLQNAKSDLFEAHSRVWKLRMKRNKKATKLMITIVVVFYILILPGNIFYLCYTFGKVSITDFQTLMYTLYLLQVFSMLNAAVNPIIYSKLHTSFRRTTLKVICSCFFSRFKNYGWQSMRDSFRATTMTSFRKKSSKSSITSRITRDSIATPIPFHADMLHRPSIRSQQHEDLMNPALTPMCDDNNHNYHLGLNYDCEDWSPATVSVQTSLDDGESVLMRDHPTSSFSRIENEPLLEESSFDQLGYSLSPRLRHTQRSPIPTIRRTPTRSPLARSPLTKQKATTDSIVDNLNSHSPSPASPIRDSSHASKMFDSQRTSDDDPGGASHPAEKDVLL